MRYILKLELIVFILYACNAQDCLNQAISEIIKCPNFPLTSHIKSVIFVLSDEQNQILDHWKVIFKKDMYISSLTHESFLSWVKVVDVDNMTDTPETTMVIFEQSSDDLAYIAMQELAKSDMLKKYTWLIQKVPKS